jgi:hypothetical protein
MNYYTQIKNLIEKVGVKNICVLQRPTCTIYRITLKNSYYLYISLDEPCLWMGWGSFSIKYKGSIIDCDDFGQKRQLKSYIKTVIDNHVMNFLS